MARDPAALPTMLPVAREQFLSLFVAYTDAVGLWTGHRYPAAPMFGITPCPVTLFTLGLFLLTTRPVPVRLLASPLAWSLVGGSAAFLLHVPQDWPLLASGLTVPLIVVGRRPASP